MSRRGSRKQVLLDNVFFPRPLLQNRPRPESRDNLFCLSCHTADGRGKLDLDALALHQGVNAPYDHRRQPMHQTPMSMEIYLQTG